MYETTGYYPNLSAKKKKLADFPLKELTPTGENDITVIPPDELLRNTGWKKTTLLLLMGNIGSGVLTIPYAVTTVGLVPGVAMCIIMFFVTRYTGVLLVKVFVKNQDCHTMGDLAERLCGLAYARFVYGGVYLYNFFMICYYFVAASKAIRDIKYMCSFTAALWCGLGLFPFFQLRTLREVSHLGVLSYLTIFAVVVICLQQGGEWEADVTNDLYRTTSVFEFFSAAGTIGYAYNGQLLYTEMMYEMRDPKEFVKCLNYGLMVQFVTYTTTGVLGWYLIGNSVPPYLLDVIPEGSMRSAAAVLMIWHLISTMLPKTQILIRVLHRKLDAVSVDALHYKSQMFWRGTRSWLLISIFLYLGMFVVVNTIPFFDDLAVLMGCLFDPTINLATPTILFWLFLRRNGRATSISMKISWIFGAVLAACLMIFGTTYAFNDWKEKSSSIWTCDS